MKIQNTAMKVIQVAGEGEATVETVHWGWMIASNVVDQVTGPEIVRQQVVAEVLVHSCLRRGDRYAVDRDRYIDDRYDRGRYGDSDRYEDRYGSRDRYVIDSYPPAGDRYAFDRYGNSDRYPNGNGKDRGYDGDGGGWPARYEGRNCRDRAGPCDRPRRGRPSSFDQY